MGIFGLGREGVWHNHRNMRAPILIDPTHYQEGYPDENVKMIDIIHDGGDYMIVYVEGKTKHFTESLYEAEPDLTDSTLSGLLQKILDYSKRPGNDRKKELCIQVLTYIRRWVNDGAIGRGLDENELEILNSEAFNHHWDIRFPSKAEIFAKKLRPDLDYDRIQG